MADNFRMIRMSDAFSSRAYRGRPAARGLLARGFHLARALTRQSNASGVRRDELRGAEEISMAGLMTGNVMIVSSAGAGGDDCLPALLAAHSSISDRSDGGGFVLLDTMFDPQHWGRFDLGERQVLEHAKAIVPSFGDAADERAWLIGSIRQAVLSGGGLYAGIPGGFGGQEREPAACDLLGAVIAAVLAPDAPATPAGRPFIVAIRDIDQWPSVEIATLFRWAPRAGIRIVATTRFDRLGLTAQAVPAANHFDTVLIFRTGSLNQAEMAIHWLDMDDRGAVEQLRIMDRGRCVILQGGETRYGWLTRVV